MPFYYYYIMLSIISLLFTWYVWSDLDYTMFAIAGHRDGTVAGSALAQPVLPGNNCSVEVEVTTEYKLL